MKSVEHLSEVRPVKGRAQQLSKRPQPVDHYRFASHRGEVVVMERRTKGTGYPNTPSQSDFAGANALARMLFFQLGSRKVL